MQARLSDSADLGPVDDGVTFFGHVLTFDWASVDFDAATLAKAKANPCIEVRERAEAKPAKADKTETAADLSPAK